MVFKMSLSALFVQCLVCLLLLSVHTRAVHASLKSGSAHTSMKGRELDTAFHSGKVVAVRNEAKFYAEAITAKKSLVQMEKQSLSLAGKKRFLEMKWARFIRKEKRLLKQYKKCWMNSVVYGSSRHEKGGCFGRKFAE